MTTGAWKHAFTLRCLAHSRRTPKAPWSATADHKRLARCLDRGSGRTHPGIVQMSTVERVVAVGAGILIMILAIPMVAGRVRPNWWYGIRTRETLGDESVWYEVNAKSGRGFLLLGALLTVLALTTASELLWVGVALVGTVAWGVWSILLGRSIHRHREGRHGG